MFLFYVLCTVCCIGVFLAAITTKFALKDYSIFLFYSI